MNDILHRLKEHLVRIVLGLLVLVVFLVNVAGGFEWGFIQRMENLAYDARLRLSMPNTRDNRIVIVNVDERSLQQEGRWPWGRDKLARLVDQLFDHYQTALVAFDVVFAEPDDSSGLKVLERLAAGELRNVPQFVDQLEALRPSLDHDGLFAQAIAKHPIILGYYFNVPTSGEEASKVGALPPPTFVKGSFQGRKIQFHVAGGYNANLEAFQAKALSAGHFVPTVDDDGVVRRVPMLYQYDGAYYESLSLAVARAALGAKDVQPRFEPAPWGAARSYSGLEWLQVGDRLIPIDERVQALVPYRGRQGAFPYVSATDVLSGNADPSVLRGAMVIVGTTAPGLFDLRATPVQNAYAGVEIHANLITGILDQNIKQRPAYTLGAEFVILAVTGLAMAVVLPLLGPITATLVTLGILAASVALNLWVWYGANLVLPIASGVIMILLMFLLNMSYGYFVEARGKRQLSGMFGHYVPPELVEEMSKNPKAYSLEAESREMTVLFTDIRGFTTISEGLNPKELSQLMNVFLTLMTQVIHKHRGTIDKYMGDAVMAFWGAPLPDPDHARHAIQAGMEMVQRLGELNKEFKDRGWPPITIGIGINTGVMSVGNMGSEFRQAYTVLGDAVNLGSRLEGASKDYGTPVVVSEATRAAIPDHVFRELDRVRVRGKEQPVAIFEPLGPATEIDKAKRDELKLYKQALAYYRAENWDMAEIQFLNLAKTSRVPYLYQMYAQRVAYFRQHPPEAGWNGVWTRTTK